MTTYSTISNASVAVGGIPASTTVTALRDNPIAISEAATGAPIIAAGWHPVDKVTVGDGKTGLIYDFAVTGAVANVTTADFEDGYEYCIFASGLSHNQATNESLQLYAYMQTDAAYALIKETGTANNTNLASMHAQFFFPRLVTTSHLIMVMGNIGTNFINQIDSTAAAFTATAQKVLRARLKFSLGNIDAGKVYMFRRREFASLP